MGESVHSFRVLGNPVPQGSMRAFLVKGRPILTSTSKNLKEWRNLIAGEAQNYLREQVVEDCWNTSGFYSYTEPVGVTAKFYFARPKSHLKKSGELTKSAPRSKHSKPDVDKLARAVLDALTGVFFEDDSQVVHLTVLKEYAEPGNGPGLEIQIGRHDRTSK